jgi:hypothetical protein
VTDGGAEMTAPRLARTAFAVGAAGLVVCLIGALLDSRQFFRSYLFAFVFWFTIPLGSLAILMLHHLVGGAWGWAIRRLLEAATTTLPLIALLFVPLLFGLREVYPWAQAQQAGADEVVLRKLSYLNAPFFTARSAFYLALWGVLGHLLSRWSREQDRSSPTAERRMRRLSGPGLVLYVLSMSFASVDWIMSIEPHWYSTIYGVLWIVNQGVGALAFVILALGFLEEREPFLGRLRPDHFHDLGNLLLAFVMLWAYMAFSQYLIVWSGNLAEEIPWYLRRTEGRWQWVPATLIVFHFFVPFVLLLMRDIKRKSKALLWIAAWILGMRLVDTFWLIVPGYDDAALHWMDPALIVGIGGIWLGAFLQRLQKSPLLPAAAPLAAEESVSRA